MDNKFGGDHLAISDNGHPITGIVNFFVCGFSLPSRSLKVIVMHLYIATAAIVIVFTRATTTIPVDLSGVDSLLIAADQVGPVDSTSPPKRQRTGPAEGDDDEEEEPEDVAVTSAGRLPCRPPRSAAEIAEERRVVTEYLRANPDTGGVRRIHGAIREWIDAAGLPQPQSSSLSESIGYAREALGIPDPRRAETELRAAIVREVVGDNPAATDRELYKWINELCHHENIPTPDPRNLRGQVRRARKALARSAAAAAASAPLP